MSPAQAAHIRLLEARTLAVREHRQQSEVIPAASDDLRYAKRKVEQLGLPGIARPLYVGKAYFDSITQATRLLHVSTSRVYAMLDSGDARYA